MATNSGGVDALLRQLIKKGNRNQYTKVVRKKSLQGQTPTKKTLGSLERMLQK